MARVAKRHQPVDTDYAIFSKFFKEVGTEMAKVSYSTTSKDVAMTGRTDGPDTAGVCRRDHSQSE